MSLLRVLCLSPYYLPGYKAGGALRSIVAMVDHLKNDLHFKIFTTDRDLLDNVPYSGIQRDRWIETGPSEVYYASPKSLSFFALIKVLNNTPHDILYLNSFFNPRFTVFPLFARRLGLMSGRPVVIAPRGEFSKGALNLKGWKKKPFIVISRALGLYKNVIWQASSAFEADDIREIMHLSHIGNKESQLVIAPDLAIIPSNSPETQIKDGNSDLRICFISRISPKKNLDFVLYILSQIKSPLIFDIFGPIEDLSYWKTCEEIIAEIKAPVIVNYQGSITNDKVGTTFGDYDLFFFPTHGENYGHVIVESMLAGTPVLLSDSTPWRNLEIYGVGWDLSLENSEGFIEAISKISSLDNEERYQMRSRVKAYAHRALSDPAILESNKLLFKLAHQGADIFK